MQTGSPFKNRTMEAYESRLQRESRWALAEGSRFFEEKSAVQNTLRKITQKLGQLNIPYAVAGGMALFAHGFRRFTEDVDLLVTSEGLKRIHKELEGLGYVTPFTGSKNLRDADTKVKIEFLITGQFPGDGKPKPVAFPDPTSVVVEKDGIKYLNLPSLVELKLASGITEPTRLKDLSDVMELIKLLDLSEEFSNQLAPFVREKFLELWRSVGQAPKRFVQIWRNKFLTLDAKGINEMAKTLRESAELLEAMRADGVILDPSGGTADDYAYLVTTDPAIAKKYGMHDESEFWGDKAEEEDTPDAP
jgi:hypothetical protein